MIACVTVTGPSRLYRSTVSQILFVAKVCTVCKYAFAFACGFAFNVVFKAVIGFWAHFLFKCACALKTNTLAGKHQRMIDNSPGAPTFFCAFV